MEWILCFVLRVYYVYIQIISTLAVKIPKLMRSLSENKVDSGFFLNVIVRQGVAILKLFARDSKALLVRRNDRDDS